MELNKYFQQFGDDILYYNKYKRIYRLGKKHVFSEKPNFVLTTCSTILTENNWLILLTHGRENGYLENYNSVLDVITNPKLDNFQKMIVCCHPKQVGENYPELKKYLLASDYSGRIYSFVPVRTNLEDFPLQEFCFLTKDEVM